MNPANLCPECGKPVPADSQHQLCPACLMAQAMASQTAEGKPAAAATPPSPEEIAGKFPQFEILECLGRGGMGVVYKARQKSLNRLVAIKILAPERERDARFAERFAREAELLAKLSHPHIVTIHDFGAAGGLYFLVMEFVDGVNLRQAMKAGRFTPEQALAIVPPVCEALQYAHEHGIVHRDIKPENLLLDREGRVKIADFGIAKIIGSDADISTADEAPQTATLASVAGTPQYMAPEQKAHRVTDHRADIYSLGVVLYELLTGELPADQLQPPSRKVQIDVRLDEIVLRALEKTPELRYQTAGEFRTQVETMTGSAGVPPVEPSVAAVPSRFSRAAIWAAGWITLSTFVVPPFIWHESETHEFMRAGPFASLLLGLIWFVFLIPAFTAPLGATLLGWIAVTQIRRSAGKLYGLGLAVFDGLLFPLLALDGLIGWLLKSLTQLFVEFYANEPMRQRALSDPEHIHLGFVTRLANALAHHELIVTFVLIVSAIVVDYFIIRAVWRAVNRTAGGTDARPQARASGWRKGWISAGIAALIAMVLRIFVVGAYVISGSSAEPELPAGSRILVWKPGHTFTIGDMIAYDHAGNTFAGRVVSAADASITVNRNGQPDESISRSQVTGKVISVYWRATASAGAAGKSPASATDETWSPAPGVKPDLPQIFAEAQELRARGRYEEALQRHLWLHRHALETDPRYSAVRLSFWLADWTELARRYPKAKEALIEIRDHDTREVAAGRGHFDLFMDVDGINAYLQDEAATLALFQQLEHSDPQLARQCAIVLESRAKGREKNTPPPGAWPAK